MSNVRYFSGGREGGKKNSIAHEIMKIEVQKGGKMPAQMRYKLIFKRRLEEAKKKDMTARLQNQVGGEMIGKRKMSKRAEDALKQVSQKKAIKEAKALRRMVIIQPQNFSNGQLKKDGRIFDIAGNAVGKVNTKNGRMSMSNGYIFGKYKPKSYYTRLLIQDAIQKHSPYFIQQRLMQQRQQALNNVHGQYDPNVINVHGMVGAQAAMLGAGYDQNMGVHGALQGMHGERSIHGMSEAELNDPYHMNPMRGNNANMTAWGAMADNVHGQMSNNVWGNMGDNVWGTTNADVWGSVGGNSMWGQRGVRFFGTGSGDNYLGKWSKMLFGRALSVLFRMVGYVPKKERDRMRNQMLMRQAYRNSSGPRMGGGPRAGSGGGSSGGARRR